MSHHYEEGNEDPDDRDRARRYVSSLEEENTCLKRSLEDIRGEAQRFFDGAEEEMEETEEAAIDGEDDEAILNHTYNEGIMTVAERLRDMAARALVK